MVSAAAVLPTFVPLVACVHDELIYECPRTEAEQYKGLIKGTMKGAFQELFGPQLPILVDGKSCSNWAEKLRRLTLPPPYPKQRGLTTGPSGPGVAPVALTARSSFCTGVSNASRSCSLWPTCIIR